MNKCGDVLIGAAAAAAAAEGHTSISVFKTGGSYVQTAELQPQLQLQLQLRKYMYCNV